MSGIFFVLFSFFTPFLIWASCSDWSWPVGGKHVKDVSYCVVGLKHEQFGFDFRRQDSSLYFSLWLAGEAAMGVLYQ